MKYRLTEKGKELFTWEPIDRHLEKSDFKNVNIKTALDLGLCKEIPERIDLKGSHKHLFISKSDGEFTEAQQKKLEHCINNEWDQIEENLEFMIHMINDYGDGRLSRNNLVCFLREKINRL